FLHALDDETLKRNGLSSAAIELDYIVPNSPAEKSGLRAGDWIIDFLGQSFRDAETLQRLISATRPDTIIKLRIRRKNHDDTFSVTLATQPSQPDTLPGEIEWGVQLSALTPDVKRLPLVPPDAAGVVVAGVHPRFRAANLLNQGDVITKINGH